MAAAVVCLVSKVLAARTPCSTGVCKTLSDHGDADRRHSTRESKITFTVCSTGRQTVTTSAMNDQLDRSQCQVFGRIAFVGADFTADDRLVESNYPGIFML